MCLIVTSRTGFAELSDAFVTDVWLANRDGFGVMYAQDGRLHAWRGLPALDGILASIRRVPQGAPAAIHFRKATRGSTAVANAHPHWLVPGRIALMHNGALEDVPAREAAPTDGASDTVAFVDGVLGPLLSADPGLLEQPGFVQWLARRVGRDNRLVLLSESGRMVRVNGAAGSYRGELWYSKDPTRAMAREAQASA